MPAARAARDVAPDSGARAGEVRLGARDAAARELMLAAASDWAFLIATGTNVDYARRRASGHVARALELAAIARSSGSARPEAPPTGGERDEVPVELCPRAVLEWAYAIG